MLLFHLFGAPFFNEPVSGSSFETTTNYFPIQSRKVTTNRLRFWYFPDFIEPLQTSRIESINSLNSKEKVKASGKSRWIVNDVWHCFRHRHLQLSCSSSAHMKLTQTLLDVDTFTIVFPYHPDNHLNIYLSSSFPSCSWYYPFQTPLGTGSTTKSPP